MGQTVPVKFIGAASDSVEQAGVAKWGSVRFLPQVTVDVVGGKGDNQFATDSVRGDRGPYQFEPHAEASSKPPYQFEPHAEFPWGQTYWKNRCASVLAINRD